MTSLPLKPGLFSTGSAREKVGAHSLDAAGSRGRTADGARAGGRRRGRARRASRRPMPATRAVYSCTNYSANRKCTMSCGSRRRLRDEAAQPVVSTRRFVDCHDHDRQPAVCVDAVCHAAAGRRPAGSCRTSRPPSRCSFCFRPGSSRSTAGSSIGWDRAGSSAPPDCCAVWAGRARLRDDAADAVHDVLRGRHRRGVRL